MSLAKWMVGLITFQILVVVLIIGISPVYTGANYNSEAFEEASINSSSTIDVDDLSFFDKVTYTVSDIPFPFNFLVVLPSIITGILGFLYIRGVN